jgi:hypothetical protein
VLSPWLRLREALAIEHTAKARPGETSL